MSNKCWCGSSDYEAITRLAKNAKLKDCFQIIRCQNCGLARTSPEPAEQEKGPGYYLGEEDSSYRTGDLKIWYKFADRLLEIVKPYKKNGALLDVGTNIGVLVDAAIKRGYDAKGMDICQSSIKDGQKLFNLPDKLLFLKLTEANFVDSFDVITYNHVLEHIKNINAELAAANKALKTGGLICIAVPNFDSIWRRILRNKWRGLAPEQHYWQFEQSSLEKILRKNSFIILKTFKRRNTLYHLNFTPAGLIKALLILLAKTFRQGDNLIILAQKI